MIDDHQICKNLGTIDERLTNDFPLKKKIIIDENELSLPIEFLKINTSSNYKKKTNTTSKKSNSIKSKSNSIKSNTTSKKSNSIKSNTTSKKSNSIKSNTTSKKANSNTTSKKSNSSNRPKKYSLNLLTASSNKMNNNKNKYLTPLPKKLTINLSENSEI